jgi:hypothetical protein
VAELIEIGALQKFWKAIKSNIGNALAWLGSTYDFPIL